MAMLDAGILYWLASGVGLFLIGYVLLRWRKSARACYPMPFRRRKGYLAVHDCQPDRLHTLAAVQTVQKALMQAVL
mgnify:CR=1 FL=1